MASNIFDLSSTASIKFDREFEDFSKLHAHQGHRSDVFFVSRDLFKWYAICLCATALITSLLSFYHYADYFGYEDCASEEVKKEDEYEDSASEEKGAKEDEYEGYTSDNNLNQVAKTENEKTSAQLIIEYPLARQPFGEEQYCIKVGFCEDKEFKDVGGFSIFKAHVPLYKQIWLKYGHIPSTKVIPIASYPILVMVVKDLMISITDMHNCHFIDLSYERIGRWEEMITMAEKLEFNIGWLRERFEHVKKGMGKMLNVKTELLNLSPQLRATKAKMRVLRNVMTKVEVQLIALKEDVRGKVSGLLSESDIETYLEIGEDLLLEGLLDEVYELDVQ